MAPACSSLSWHAAKEQQSGSLCLFRLARDPACATFVFPDCPVYFSALHVLFLASAPSIYSTLHPSKQAFSAISAETVQELYLYDPKPLNSHRRTQLIMTVLSHLPAFGSQLSHHKVECVCLQRKHAMMMCRSCVATLLLASHPLAASGN